METDDELYFEYRNVKYTWSIWGMLMLLYFTYPDFAGQGESAVVPNCPWTFEPVALDRQIIWPTVLSSGYSHSLDPAQGVGFKDMALELNIGARSPASMLCQTDRTDRLSPTNGYPSREKPRHRPLVAGAHRRCASDLLRGHRPRSHGQKSSRSKCYPSRARRQRPVPDHPGTESE